MGYKVANTFNEYYEMKIVKEGMHKHKANLLPYNLILTIYGIGSIQPGDIFKVDYLPERYQKNTFLQTMKVSHEIGSGGWYTTIEGKFRLKPEEKQKYYDIQNRAKVRLSAKAIQTLQLETKIQVNNATGWSAGYADDYFPFEELSGYMTDIVIDYQPTSKIDLMMDFRTNSKLSELISSGDGIIQNFEGNFKALFPSWNQAKTTFPSLDLSGESWVKHTHKSSYDLVYHQDIQGWNLGGIVSISTISPRDCKLEPGKEYSLWVHGNSWCIIEKEYKKYDKVKDFFMKHIGYNIPTGDPHYGPSGVGKGIYNYFFG